VATGHAVRGAASAALALIALEALSSAKSTQVGGFFGDVSRLLARAIAPDVPLIRDRRSSGTYDADGNFHPTIPDWLGGGTTTGPGAGTSGQQQNPNFRIGDPPPIGQHNPQYDNPNPGHPGGVQV
jgi:hypothetical protein